MIIQGTVLNVSSERTGNELAVDAPVGSTTLYLEDAFAFNADRGGQITLNDVELVYTTADYELATITLAEPLAVEAWIGDNVYGFPRGYQKVAMVDLSDEDEGIRALIAMSPERWKTGIRDYNEQESVLVSDENGRWEVVALDQESVSIDAEALDPETFEQAGLTPLEQHLEAVRLIEEDIQSTVDLINSGDSENSQAINDAVDDFNAGLATKSKHTLSPNVPGTTANNAGDVWERHKAGDITKIIGRWRGAGGTSWTLMNLDATYIPLLDIGSGTFGDLSGARILADTIGVEKLLISSFDNLVSDPLFEQAIGVAWQSASYSSISTTGSRNGGRALVITNSGIQNYVFNLPLDLNKIEAGQALRFDIPFKSSVSHGSGLVRVSVNWKSYTGTVTTVSLTGPSATAGVWTKIAGTLTAPANTVSFSFSLNTTDTLSSGQTTFDTPKVTRAANGELIVDGAIQAKHITADMVNGLLATFGVIQTNQNGPAYGTTPTGVKISQNGIVSYDGGGVPTTSIAASTGRISAVGGLATATGYEDISIEPGNGFSPALMRFWMNGQNYDNNSPAALSSFSIYQEGGNLYQTSFYVRFQGAKSTQYSTAPRIDIVTVAAPANYLRAHINYHAGGAGAGTGVGGHNFYIDGVQRALVDYQGISADNVWADNQGGGATAAAYLNVDGKVTRTSSTRRHKKSISTLRLDEASKVLDLRPVRFKWRKAMRNGEDFHPGFIAEEVHEAGMGLWVNYDKDGKPEGVRYPELTAALLAVVKDLNDRVTRMESSHA